MSWNQHTAGGAAGALSILIRVPFWKPCRVYRRNGNGPLAVRTAASAFSIAGFGGEGDTWEQRGPSTWRLQAFAEKTNGRKQYTSKTFHGTKMREVDLRSEIERFRTLAPSSGSDQRDPVPLGPGNCMGNRIAETGGHGRAPLMSSLPGAVSTTTLPTGVAAI